METAEAPNLFSSIWTATVAKNVAAFHPISLQVNQTLQLDPKQPAAVLAFTFHFHFVDIERHYKAETGSGDFRTYWRMAKRFAKEKRDRNEPLFQITELTP
jgi:hypothetical protein